jgi:MFS family permease
MPPVDPNDTPKDEESLGFRALLANRDLSLFLVTRLIAGLSRRMVMLAVGWQIYDITRSPSALGVAGLASFGPAILLLLPSGALADRYDRRVTVSVSFVALALAIAALGGLSMTSVATPGPYYAAMVVYASAFALYRPSATSMLPALVRREQLGAASGWHQSSLQIGTIVGPALGGILYGFGAKTVYFTAATLNLVGAVATAALRKGGTPRPHDPSTSGFKRLTAGFGYIWNREILLGAISLDLFSSIVGGVTALLPIYARDILSVGTRGLGALRSAPALGGVLAGLVLANIPVRHRGGRVMFGAVTLSGLATIAFGLSQIFLVSMVALAAMGALDLIASNIRLTLVQLATPDEMRGRVNAVQQMSNSTSADLGDFISGVTAGWLGAPLAVAYGGLAAISVAGMWMWHFPGLRRVDSLTDVVEPEAAADSPSA